MNSSTNTNVFTRYIAMLVLGAAVLAGGLAALAMRAHADTLPIISNVIATPTDTASTITWSTDQPGSTQVMYGLTTSYNASSTLNTASTTSHTAFLGGLTPNTLYHFEVVTSNASGTATSSDTTFTTASSTATTTPPVASSTPVISTVLATPSQTGATITWSTNIKSNSQVMYGLTNAYGNTTTLDPTLVTGHSVLVPGLAPSTLYHFQVLSSASSTASSPDMTFTTLAASSTGGGTGTTTDQDDTTLQDEITSLQSRVSTLEAEVAALMGMGGGGTTTPPGTGGATADQNNSFITAGSPMDLGGRNFGHEETVVVTLNGTTVATAHADGGGNFSTGSFTAPSTPGAYTFVFTGQTSGDTASTNIVIH